MAPTPGAAPRRLGRCLLSPAEQQQVERSVRDLTRASRAPNFLLATAAGLAGIGALFDPTGTLAIFAVIFGLGGLGLGLAVGRWRRPFLKLRGVHEGIDTLALVQPVPGKRRSLPGMEVLARRHRLRSAEMHFRAKGHRVSNPIPWGLVRRGLNRLLIVSGPGTSPRASPRVALLLSVNGTLLSQPGNPPIWLRWEEPPSPPGRMRGQRGPLRLSAALLPILQILLPLVLVMGVVGSGAGFLNVASSTSASPHLLPGSTAPRGVPSPVQGAASRGDVVGPSDSYCTQNLCDGLLLADQNLNATEGIVVGGDICGVDQFGQTVLDPSGATPVVPCPTSGWNTGDQIYTKVVPSAGGVTAICHISWGDGSTFDSACGYSDSTIHVYSSPGSYNVTGYLCYSTGSCDSEASVEVYINLGLGGAATVAGITGLGLGFAGVVPVAGGGSGPTPPGGLGGSAYATAPYYPPDFQGSDGLWGGEGSWADPYTYLEASPWQAPVTLPPPPFSPAQPSPWIPQLPAPTLQPIAQSGADSIAVPSTSDGQVVDMAAIISVQGGDPNQPFTYTWRTDDGMTYSVVGGPDSSISHWFQTPGPHTISVTVSQPGVKPIQETFTQL